MAFCHYITVSPCCGGVGGSRSVMPSARNTAAARWVPRVTERLVVPSPRSMSTTRTGLERRQGFGGGKIEACGLELLFDGAVEQEGERRDVDVSVDAAIGAVIDRPHVEDILEV